MSGYILAIDQGTTSTRAIAFDRAFAPVASAQTPLGQHFPQPGWVEHDPEEIWAATLAVCRDVIDQLGGAGSVAAIGLTNQRETTLVWDRATGRAIHNAIVWQDRRTAAMCTRLREEGHEPFIQNETGLLLDPYFSATKLAWLLEHPGAGRDPADLAFGTVDSFLLWRLTGGEVHATDVTNASRTLLLGRDPLGWRADLCALFGAPQRMLPQVLPSAGHFGATAPDLFGRAIPITGVAGDQQAALVGHGCFAPGQTKATYGTGCFLMMNAGRVPARSSNRLLATIGYQLGEAAPIHALEGAIFSAGATVEWLRTGAGLLKDAKDSAAIASSVADNGGVYLVPAFAGLGAPQWEPNARGAIVGLTRDSTAAHIVRAGLEAIAYQTADLLDALFADGAPPLAGLAVDGGLTANDWAMQFLADICQCPVERPAFQEMTAIGVARLAALGAGLSEFQARADAGAGVRWTPSLEPDRRADLRRGWARAVAGVVAHARP